MQTSAIVFTQTHRVEVQRIEMPPPAAGQVQIRTALSTISAGTEGWALADRFTWARTPFPCVPGYERVGVITAIGENVTGWSIGERAFATMGVWEGPVKPFWGSHIALANTPAGELYHIPANVSDVNASALVVAQVGYNAAHRPTLSPGDWVLVYGDGIIGQCGAEAARARGAKVILVGHRRERIELAQKHSADHVIDSKAGNVADAVKGLTTDQRIAVVIDTVQNESAQVEYVPLLENGRGQIVYSGFTPCNVWANQALLQQHELTTHYIAGWTRRRMEGTLALMSEGKMSIEPLLTHRVPATRAGEMYRMIEARSEPFMAIALDWKNIE